MSLPRQGRIIDAFEWHYYKLYVGSNYDALDFVITHCLDEAIRKFGEHGWFFLRYIDEGGLHLRVRFRLRKEGDRNIEPHLYATLHDGLSLLSQRLQSVHSPLVTFGGLAVRTPVETFGVHCQRSLYEPEVDTFGGEAGVAIAEDVFCTSSALARAILLNEEAAKISRKDCVLPLYIEAVNTYIPEKETCDFLERYATFWLSGDPEIGAHKSAFAEKAYSMIDEGITILPPTSEYSDEVSGFAKQWRNALIHSRERYKRLCPAYSKALADTLGFHFAHLMNNRLGFNTLEESYLAILLSKSYESGYRYATS